jgi:hypothetical protein
MPDYICHGCNQRKSQTSGIYQCSKCGKILCQSCIAFGGYGGSTCKDSPKGTAGCPGTLKRK